MDEITRKPPRMPLSDQIRIAGEMAHPSIRGFAAMMLDEWQPEAVRLEQQLTGSVEALREIANADPVDMALDPGWAARIAKAALDATGVADLRSREEN